MAEMVIALSDVIESLKQTTDDHAATLPPDGDWHPMMFIIKGENFGIARFVMPPSGPMRDFFFESVLPNQIKPHEPDAVVILVSTWVAAGMGKEEYEKMQAGEALRPSERPDRKEAVLIQGVAKDGEEQGIIGEIIRGGEHPELDWDSFPSTTGYEGNLLSALRRGVWG